MTAWPSLDAQVSGALPCQVTAHLQAFWQSRSPLPVQRTISLRLGQPPKPPTQAQAAQLTLMEQSVHALWHGDELWLGDLYAQVSAHKAILLGQHAPEAAWALALTEAHRAGGWLPLHAAVFARAGRAVALTGTSGAGKSTAALRLLEAGYSVIAEDRAFWHSSNGQIAGLDQYLRAFDDSVERFAPSQQATAVGRDPKGKLLLPLPANEAATLVCLLAFGDGLALPLPQRVRLLWETTGVPLTDSARHAVQQGIGQLLPLVRPQTVTRETVLETVKTLLDNEAKCNISGGY